MKSYLENKIKAAKLQQQEVRVNSKEQFTLGKLINELIAIKKRFGPEQREDEPSVIYDFAYIYPTSIDSWRGSYDELALNWNASSEGNYSPLTVSNLLDILIDADGGTFEGYKGGEFVMSRHTPIWVANSRESGSTAVVGVINLGYQVVIETKYMEY